jgi:hypothetical protein
MRLPLALPFLVSACGFTGGDGEPSTPDARVCVPGFVDLCGQPEPSGNFIISNTTINTDTDGRCRTLTQKGAIDVCLLYFTEVEIQAGGTLLAHGGRPLVLASKNAMKIAGTIDVSASKTRPTMQGAGGGPLAAGLCTFNAEPETAEGGGGGGAGGTFATLGGLGGTGNLDGSDRSDANRAGGKPGVALAALGVLRGGCNGQPGAMGDAPSGAPPGQGGGAVYLTAASVEISGAVRAGGSGGGAATGVDDGGGGGGSGGAIVVESPVIKISGTLIATGGGGGKGANGLSDGEAGDDGVAITPAAGGLDGAGGGPGGNGATDAAGASGVMSNGGGGGGGGGTGFVLLLGGSPLLEGSLIMPPATSRVE